MISNPSTLIDKYIQQGSFSGAALVVARHNQIVYEYYAGDAAPGLPASANVLWPLASISKVYSAAAIMKLMEMGELPLSTLVSQVLPKFTGEGRELVRLRHLLTHTAGMIYESPEMEARLIAQTPLSDLIEEMYRAPLNFSPGTSIAYADYHYLLAGHVAATVTGTPFHELVQNLVIKPMGLEQTWFPPPAALHSQIAKVHAVMAEGTEGAMYNSAYALGLAHPAFGVVASAADVVRFALHFAPGGPRIHSEATVRAMTTVQTGLVRGQPAIPALGSPGNIIPWGLGFCLQTEHSPGIFSELASLRSFGHGGASGCQLMVDPEANVVVALVSNTHARSGRETWYPRLQSIVNCALANVD
ncbi:MAG: serine hydrolase domain-containing protein [Caldilineaceae bacterium]